MDTKNVRTKLEVRSFISSGDNRGYSKNFGSHYIYLQNLKFVALRVPGITGGILKEFEKSLDTPMLPFLPNNWGAFVSMDALHLPHLKFVALPVPEIIGGTRKIWTVPGYAHAPFSRKFLMVCVRMDHVNLSGKFEVPSFGRSWDNSDCSFGWLGSAIARGRHS